MNSLFIKQTRIPFIALLIIFSFFSIIAIKTDYSYISPNDYLLYFSGRIFFFVFGVCATAYCFFCKDMDKLRKLQEISLFVMFLYSVHGQMFVPCYYLGYTQFLFISAVFFPIRTFVFRSFVLFFWVGIVLAILFGAHYDGMTESAIQKFKYDSITAVSIFSIGGLICQWIVANYIFKYLEISSRFSEMGFRVKSVVHDLKGYIAAPRIVAKALKIRVEKNKDKKLIMENIEDLEMKLEFLSNFTKEYLSLDSNESDQWHCFRDVFRSVSIIMQKELVGVKVNFLDDIDSVKFFIKKGTLLKIVYNLVLNSIEHIRENCSGKDIVIDFSFKNNTLIIKDNGRGFSENVLKKIKTNYLTIKSEKEYGSGFGLCSVIFICEENGISMNFKNNNGAVVELVFNKKKVMYERL